MVPLVPAAGEICKVTVTGKLLKDINEGWVHFLSCIGAFVRITAKIGVLVVKTDLLNSCELAVKQGLGPCPLRPSDYPSLITQTVDYLVPDDVPKGVTFQLRSETSNQDGSRISCFTGPMQIQGEDDE
jgi:hypothetical protein